MVEVLEELLLAMIMVLVEVVLLVQVFQEIAVRLVGDQG